MHEELRIGWVGWVGWFGLVGLCWVGCVVGVGLVWVGLGWFDLVWFGLVWFGLVRSGLFEQFWGHLGPYEGHLGLSCPISGASSAVLGVVWFGLVWFGWFGRCGWEVQ